MNIKNGDIVTSRVDGRLLERVNGKPGSRMVPISKGSVGRIVSRRASQKWVGQRASSNVYLVKFVGGIVELRAEHLDKASSDEVRLSPGAIEKADPDLKVNEKPVEEEPDY